MRTTCLRAKRLLRGVALVCAISWSPQANALQGDEKLACEAILCLAASGSRPDQCWPSIRKFFSISARRFSDTLRGRLNFLNLCPIVGRADMSGLRDALVNGSGRCDAPSLNQATYNMGDENTPAHVGNVMPGYCEAYFGNGMVQGQMPLYVGAPMSGGHWVEAQDYAQALQAYEQRLELERQAR